MTDAATIAHACLEAADADTMAFPAIVGALIDAGFDSYGIDFRRGDASYYRPDGAVIILPLPHGVEMKRVAPFDVAALRAAIHDAQTSAPGYSYRGFCQRAAAAGVASYLVSFTGRRALYIATTGETHEERFPD
jgi:uncharacterized protein YbcV (DUF1398 family)